MIKAAKKIIIGCLILLVNVAAIATEQESSKVEETIKRVENSLGMGLFANEAKSKESPQERGTVASDHIRGNGARAGYNLSYGGIIPGSETVTVDGSLLRRDRDYYLDNNSGTLAFAKAVRVHQLIRITYRYSPERNKQRATLGAPNLALNFGGNTSLGITFMQNTAPNQTYDMMTYGLNMQTSLGENSNMTNMMYISSAQDSGRLPANYLTDPDANPQATPKPKTDNLFIHNSDLMLGQLNVKVNYQDVGKDFSGFNAMRQQNVAPDAVLKQLEKEKGLQRFGVDAGMAFSESSRTSFGWNRIGDSSGDIIKQTFALMASNMNFKAEVREIEETFSRMNSLTNQEKKEYGKEIGMRRTTLTGDLKLSDDVGMKASYSNVSDLKDEGDLTKYALSVKGEKFEVNANYHDMAPEFSRVNDLNDGDKKTLRTEHGMKRFDVSTRFSPNRTVRIDSYLYDAKHSTEDIFRKQLRNNIVINSPGLPKLSILFDDVKSGENENLSSFERQRYIAEHTLAGISMKAMRDTVERENHLGEERKVETSTFNFATDSSKKTSFSGDWKDVRRNDDTFEEVKTLRMNTKLIPKMDFNAVRTTISTEQNETESSEFSLAGTVARDLALRAKFGETTVDGDMVGRVRELSMVPGSPRDYGIFKGVKWSLGFAEFQTAGGHTQTRSKTAGFESLVLGHKLAAGYSGMITKDGKTPIVRNFSLVKDNDPKTARFHYNLNYKVLGSGGDTQNTLVRRYDGIWRISSDTNLTYFFQSYNERPNGQLEHIGTERLRFTTKLNNKYNVISQWENREDYARNIDRNTISLGFSGKINEMKMVEVSYGYDKVDSPGGKSSAHTYRVKYDHQVDANHYFTFSGKYTDWKKGSRPANSKDDDVRIQLDVSRLFN